MLFEPKCKECGLRCSSIEVLGPDELAVEWESWPQERRDRFAKRRSPTSHYLIYEGPGGGNGWGDEIPQERAAAILAAITNPTSETMRAAGFYDRAGMCDQCAEFYCPRHWSISETGYGRCPRGHGKSLDPHWHP